MDKNIKIKYNRLDTEKFDKQNYFNLNNKIINNKKDLEDICKKIRNSKYETFRIFFVRDNKIISHKAITSKIPNKVILCPDGNTVKLFEKMKSRINRLNADGYYLIHNHCSNSSMEIYW